MKRFRFLIVLLVAASLVLAACGAGNGNTDAFETPGVVDETLAPGGEPDLMATATLPAPLEPTVTLAPVEPTATSAAAEPTTAVTTETPAAQGEVTPLTNPYRLSTVVDADIKTRDGEDIGEIERLVINPDGSIRYGVLKTGEFLGMGGRSIFVPWQAFTPYVDQGDNLGAGDVELALNTTEEALQGFPEMDVATVDFAMTDWDKDVVAYWSGQNLTVPVTGADPTAGEPIVFNRDFDDIDVVNTQDEELGEVEDFIVDPASGQIRYAIFEMGGFLGVGERYIPVPWASLNWVQHDADGEIEVLFNVDKDQFNTAPYFESWDDVDLTSDQFDADWNAFWQGVDNTIDDALNTTPTPAAP